ncbi:hypothetical protein NL676_025702 [Syzygium grande]|nr:hypothetical protein NL676_025702 [Syzygium grande]
MRVMGRQQWTRGGRDGGALVSGRRGWWYRILGVGIWKTSPSRSSRLLLELIRRGSGGFSPSPRGLDFDPVAIVSGGGPVIRRGQVVGTLVGH